MEPQPSSAFAWFDSPWGRALRCLPLEAVARHVFTCRDIDLRGPGATAGWTRVADSLGVMPARLVRLEQVHGIEVIVVAAGEPPAASSSDEGLPHADAAMTGDMETAVAVQVADCVPLLLADPATGAVAAVHAGWRGTAGGIAGHAVRAMAATFGSRPADLVAAMGPSIGGCCYQVGPDVADAFHAAGWDEAAVGAWFRPQAGSDRFLLDVAGANRDQLTRGGLDPAHVHLCSLCTACHPGVFHSYRRDGVGTGRLAGVIRAGRGTGR